MLSAALWSRESELLTAREEVTAPIVAARAAAKRRVQRTRRNGPEVDLLFLFIGVGNRDICFSGMKQAKSSVYRPGSLLTEETGVASAA